MDEAVSQCEATLSANADSSPEAQKKMAEEFERLGVTKAMIELRIQRRLDAITPAQIISLRKIFISLRDGMSTPMDWFATSNAPPSKEGNPFTENE